MATIQTFKHNYFFLSNFYPSIINYQEMTYPTVEHAYQASKTNNPHMQEKIKQQPTPGAAKKMGRLVTLKPNWDKLAIMRELISIKFSSNPLTSLLLATYTCNLVEGNYWHDNFWGDCFCIKCKSIVGRNMLGVILEETRNSLYTE